MRKQLTAMSIMVGLTTGLSILACTGGTGGDNNGGEPCTFDADCPDGYLCDGANSGVCVPQCTSDLDCFSTESCEPRDSDPTVQLCVENTSTNNTNNGDQCTTVDDCPNTDDYVCTDGVCIDTTGGNTCTTVDDCPDTENYVCEESVCKSISSNNDNNTQNPLFIVQLEDVTSGDGCSSTTRGDGDPGSDIMYLSLLDAQGDFLGYAEQVDCQPTDNDIVNDFSSCAHIDGDAPDIDGTTCSESGNFTIDNIFSLGCGGYMLVQFLDSNDTPIALAPGYQIEVGEYGEECGGSASDSWQVFICSDTAGARNLDPSSCDTAVGSPTSGVFNVTIDSLPASD